MSKFVLDLANLHFASGRTRDAFELLAEELVVHRGMIDSLVKTDIHNLEGTPYALASEQSLHTC